MKLHALLPIALSAVVASAHAVDSHVVDFPKNMEFAAQVTLLKDDGGKVRHAPLKDGHKLQLRFDEVAESTPKSVPCTLTIPKKIGQIAPGEAAAIGIRCSEVVKLPRDQLGFHLVDGGRDIGSGAFRP